MKLAAGFLAGGLARRMGGGDKAELRLVGKTILEWQLEAVSDIECRVLNANGPADRFQHYGLPVVPDNLEGFLGPLAGLHAMLGYVQQTDPDVTHLLSLATDAPFIPKGLGNALTSALRNTDADIAIASSAGRHHPVFALWPVNLCKDLEIAIKDEGIRKIDDFTARYKAVLVSFEIDGTGNRPDPFMNINRPEDLMAAEDWLKTVSTSRSFR